MRAIHRLPEKRRAEAQVLARHEYRHGRPAPEADVLARAKQSLDYVRMLTPPAGGQTNGSAGRYVLRDGELVLATSAAPSRHAFGLGRDDRITDEQIRRHYKLVDRQHFGGRG